MYPKNSSQVKRSKGSKKGILFGIPLLLFMGGIALLSISAYKHFSYAFYLSRLFIHEDIRSNLQPIDLLDNNEDTQPDPSSTPKVKISFPSLGDQFGDLIIESVAIDYPVYHGDRDEDLLKGIGHYNGSRFPGENGNIVLSGHRNTVFKPLKGVELGDKVIFKTTYGEYEYVVTDIRITTGNDKTIVEPSDNEKLTLYTCYPFEYFGKAPKRYVITSQLISGTPLSELLGKGDKTQ